MLQLSELTGRHDKASFDCGNAELNSYLRQIAGQHARKSLARVYVACEDTDPGRIVAYYSLSICELGSEELPELFRKRFPNRVPAVRLGRLAVARANQRQGVGELMLIDAMRNVVHVDAVIGAVALLVDAKNDEAKRFYLEYRFIEMSEQPLSLFLPIASIKEALARANR